MALDAGGPAGIRRTDNIARHDRRQQSRLELTMCRVVLTIEGDANRLLANQLVT
jgi:hypothetical protein